MHEYLTRHGLTHLIEDEPEEDSHFLQINTTPTESSLWSYFLHYQSIQLSPLFPWLSHLVISPPPTDTLAFWMSRQMTTEELTSQQNQVFQSLPFLREDWGRWQHSNDWMSLDTGFITN